MLAQDNDSLFPAEGQFLMSTVQYFVASGDPVVGSLLEIRFRSLGYQTLFDDVRLDAIERVPEPALLALLGLGCAAAARRKRR